MAEALGGVGLLDSKAVLLALFECFPHELCVLDFRHGPRVGHCVYSNSPSSCECEV